MDFRLYRTQIHWYPHSALKGCVPERKQMHLNS
ncbi:hypothetical protein VCHENC02_3594, partial [Vibrio harveyi]